MPAIKAPGGERDKGYKSQIYTKIRQTISKMERDEWRQWFINRIDELQKDTELWDWIVREKKYEGRVKNGQYQRKKKGRPYDKNPNLPDTRNINIDEWI